MICKYLPQISNWLIMQKSFAIVDLEVDESRVQVEKTKSYKIESQNGGKCRIAILVSL